MKQKAEIRPAVSEDLGRVAEISASFPEGWSELSLKESLGKDFYKIFVAEVEGCVLGYCIYSTADVPELLNIAVDPRHRMQGTASALLEQTLPIFSRSGKAVLEVRRGNAPAISLYRKFGFEMVSVRKNLYSKPLEDGIVMEKIF